jgi:hypothetical protein
MAASFLRSSRRRRRLPRTNGFHEIFREQSLWLAGRLSRFGDRFRLKRLCMWKNTINFWSVFLARAEKEIKFLGMVEQVTGVSPFKFEWVSRTDSRYHNRVTRCVKCKKPAQNQGDQMGLWQIALNVHSPILFWSILIHNFYLGKR